MKERDKYYLLRKYLKGLKDYELSDEYSKLTAIEQSQLMIEIKDISSAVRRIGMKIGTTQRERPFNKNIKYDSFMSRERQKKELAKEIEDLEEQLENYPLPKVTDDDFEEANRRRNNHLQKIKNAKDKRANLRKKQPSHGSVNSLK